MSTVPAVVDAILTTLKTNVPSTCEVIDGPYLQAPDGDFVCVGWSPVDSSAASWRAEWATIGAKKRNEDVDIICYADTMTGDTSASDVKARRDGAFAIYQAVENALYSDPTLGGVLVGWLSLSEGRYIVEQTGAGLALGVEFHIIGRARI